MQRIYTGCLLPGGSLGCGTNRDDLWRVLGFVAAAWLGVAASAFGGASTMTLFPFRRAILGFLARVVLVRRGRDCDGRAVGDWPWSGVVRASIPSSVHRGTRGALSSGFDHLARGNSPNRIVAVI